MLFRIAICDDDLLFSEKLERQLKCYLDAHHADNAQIEIFSDGKSFLNRFAEQKFDMVFLDLVFQEYLDGVMVAKEIRSQPHGSRTAIIFVSSHHEYSMQLFQLNPLHFLVKSSAALPIDEIFQMYHQYYENEAMFQYPQGKITVPYSAMDYLEYQDKNCKIHLTDTDIEFRLHESFKSLCSRIKVHGFAQINQFCCVNIRHITYLQDNTIYLNSQKFTISRTFRNEFYDTYWRIYHV